MKNHKIIRVILTPIVTCIIFLNTSCTKKNSTTIDSNLPQIGSANVGDFTNITQTSASFTATIISEGSSPITAKGVCWSINHNPTTSDSKTTNRQSSQPPNKTYNGTGSTGFTASLTGLSANTTYFLRIYATNNSGTAYSNEVSFTTLGGSTNTVTDIDGNVYHTVVIGTQTWMLENLKVKKYRNGDPIPNVTNALAWENLTTGAYCDYGNNSTVSNEYGLLYNWYAVNDSRLLAPTGWHIPSQTEWQTLYNYLGGESVAGSKLKEAGNAHWTDNTDATNTSGFTALPGGNRNGDTTFSGIYIDYYDLTNWGYFWSSTASTPKKAYNYWLSHNFSYIDPRDDLKSYGYSVRCIKN